MLTRPTLNGRLPRTLRDATRDPFDFVEHYRAPLLHRWWRPLSYLLCFGTFALIGVLLAWRG